MAYACKTFIISCLLLLCAVQASSEYNQPNILNSISFCILENCKDSNEVYYNCGPACPATCQNKSPPVCIASCKSGCFCAPGFLRNERTGECVPAYSCR